MTEELKEIFEENGYKLKVERGSYEIIKRNSDFTILLFVILLFVSPIFIFIANYKALLFVILLLCAPFVYTKWRMPKNVKWLPDAKLFQISDTRIPFDKIQEMNYTEEVRTSDVNAFKEGYQDFIYTFQLKAFTNQSFDLFELKYRKSMMPLMNDLKLYFDDLIQIKD